MSETAILFKSVSRHFGEIKAVDNIELEIQDGEFFSMLGPSGSGKTTCLRMIRFDRPTSGQIILYGQDVSNLPPYERSVNTVFQDYALFPHMTVEDNIGYRLMIKGMAKPEAPRNWWMKCSAWFNCRILGDANPPSFPVDKDSASLLPAR